MALIIVACLASSILPIVHGRPQPHEIRHALPPGWSRGARVRGLELHQVQIALKNSNLDKGEESLMDVSDPDSSNYGKHWTAKQVHDFFRPSNDTIGSVRAWVGSIISSPTSLSSDWGHLHFDATNDELERLLETEFNYHHYHLNEHAVPATHAYHIPEEIHHHIDFITPGVLLHKPRRRHVQLATRHARADDGKMRPRDDKTAAACNATAMSPACIAMLYGVPGSPPRPANGYEHAIYTSGFQGYDQHSLDNFFTRYTTIPNGTHPKVYNIDGAPSPVYPTDDHDAETPIDLAVTYPLIYPATVVLLNEGDSVYQKTHPGRQNHMLDAIDASYCTLDAYGEAGDLPDWDGTYPDHESGGYKGQPECGTIKPPSVIAASWDATEDHLPIAWQRRQCHEFMKLSMQGVSFFYATGDYGIGNGTKQCYGPNNDQWAVPWPANCPYVTGVGGTQIKAGADLSDLNANHEEAMYNAGPDHDSTSSGGISVLYDRPAWQKAAVDAYLQNANIKTPGFTTLLPNISNPTTLPSIIDKYYKTPSGEIGRRGLTGRGVPDISGLADSVYEYASGDEFFGGGGTSASVHLVASMFTRINLERIANNKGPVGFVNPTLYKYADTIIRDITEGHANSGCGQEGYPIAEGWDASTGLGVLKYQEALELFLRLGDKINQ